MRNLLYFTLLVLFFGCDGNFSEFNHQALTAQVNSSATTPTSSSAKNWERIMHRDTQAHDMFPTIPIQNYDSIFSYNPEYFSSGFDFPVGIPNAQGYFTAQKFGEDEHLGEDWNAVTGGNTDLGDPVFSISEGLVTFSKNVCCGWGNVVRVIHYLPNHPDHKYVESVYAHLHHRNVRPGQLIKKGEKLGSIGNADGRYSAHLHLELRSFINMSLGPGYSTDTFGFLNPSDFISKNRN